MSNTTDLSSLPTPTLKALAKLASDLVADRREDLGQTKAEFGVNHTVTLNIKGTVKVAKSSPDAIIAQKAQPWNLLVAALEEANRQLAAAGKTGIDLERVVELAEKADPELVKQAKKKADAHLKTIKDEVRGFRWGGVRVEASCKVLSEQAGSDEEAAA